MQSDSTKLSKASAAAQPSVMSALRAARRRPLATLVFSLALASSGGLASPALADATLPKVGFEVELGGYRVVRYSATPAPRLVDIGEKSPGSYIAATTGAAPDIQNWPLIRLQADNVKTEKSDGAANRNKKGVSFFDSLDLAKAIDVTASFKGPRDEGVLEIATGPLVFSDSLREDVRKAVTTLVAVLDKGCKGADKRADAVFIAWPALQADYNGKIAADDSIADKMRALLRMETDDRVPGSTSTVYVECPSANKIDVQATFGLPLQRLSEKKGQFKASNLNWGDFARQIDRDSQLIFKGLETPPTGLSGLLQIWAALVGCATDLKGPTAAKIDANKYLVACNKNTLKPLPHVDVCALASEFWGSNAAWRKANGQKLEAALTRQVTELLEKAAGPWLEKGKKIPTPILAHVTGRVNAITDPGKCPNYWSRADNGAYMGYYDATMVPPLWLKTKESAGPGQVAELGFALELRGGAVPADAMNSKANLDAAMKPILETVGSVDVGCDFDKQGALSCAAK